MPQIYFLDPLHHPWVTPTSDKYILTGHPLFMSKDASSTVNVVLNHHQEKASWDPFTSIAIVIHEIEEEFKRHSPILGHSAVAAAAAAANDNTHRANSPFQEPGATNLVLKNYALPDFEMPDLSQLTIHQLQDLLNDESKFFDFFQNMKTIKDYKDLQTSVQEELETIASEACDSLHPLNKTYLEDNLAVGNEIQEMKKHLSTKEEELEVLKREYEKLYAKQEEIYQKFGTAGLLGRIKTDFLKSDEESHQILAKFLNGQMDTESFIVSYTDVRTAFHIRGIKYEKLKALKEDYDDEG